MDEKPTYEELERRIRELEQYRSRFSRAERDYLEQKKLLEIVVNELPFWFSLKDTDGRYLLVNKMLARAHGVPASAFIGRKTLETYELFNGGLEKMLERDNQVLKSGERLDVPEYPVTTSGGGRWRRLVKVPWKNEAGAIMGVISWSEDITEQKKAKEELLKYRDHLQDLVNQRTLTLQQEIADRERTEIALRESEEKYRLLFENATDAVFVTQDGRIKFPNPKALELIGYTEEELGSLPFADFIHPEDREMVVDRYNKRMSSEEGIPSMYSFRVINKAGEELFVNTNVVRIRWEGKPAGLNFARDMTQQRLLEARLRQAQKMESIGTLAGGIAHEFNNILGIIIGNAELALDDLPQWNPAAKYLQDIRDASLRARDVVRQILSFARITPARRKPTAIRPLIEQSLQLLRATIPKTHEIRREILCSDEMILANPTEVGQVLMNLCSNSVQAMEGKAGVLHIRLEPVMLDGSSAALYDGLGEGSYARLKVSDNGTGIDPKVMERIFEPYFTTKDVDKGLGLGLAVVYGIVKKHEGALRVTSTAGQGTTVEVLFPAIRRRSGMQHEQWDDFPGGTERILFIDDESALVAMATRMLQRYGYRVVGVTKSREALELFQSRPDHYDLIITDLAMPEMPGDVLAQKVVRIRPGIPIILCTGYSDHFDEDRLKRIGITALTMKPLSKAELARMVRRVMDAPKA